eukprot:CAMPEP_0183724190 /NCGR_PEP_ID=MMETSP0737-20130205/17629_1 /TAXON_ID=385413 /ORGANISM="Thalassiosira miniscula, Strain CCMP1093" /LENGTH=321 /DNA_ID=CAMNT_0025954715 /DNA_START=38 /DNA_END=1003 /DNA_ORIENTATION=-
MVPLQRQPYGSMVFALLLVSFLTTTTTRAEPHKQVASANTHCEISCLNGGYCSFTKYTDYPQKGDVGYYQSCTCRPGFGGGACEEIVEECQPPFYRCHNGAPCKKDEDGSLCCDCSFADEKPELAGYMCRKPTTQSCDTLDENNKSFCTNGGVCLSSMTATPKHLVFSEPTTHQGCQCDSAFSGKHCELINDMPESKLMEAAPSGISAGGKAGISLSVLAVVAVFVAMVVRRKRRELGVRQEKFRKFYTEKFGEDRNMAPVHKGGDYQGNVTEVVTEKGRSESREINEEEERESDLNSILEFDYAESQFITCETGADSRIV